MFFWGVIGFKGGVFDFNGGVNYLNGNAFGFNGVITILSKKTKPLAGYNYRGRDFFQGRNHWGPNLLY